MPAPRSAFTQGVDTTGDRATYSYVAVAFTPVATATDIITIAGVQGKVIRITSVRISADATAAGEFNFYAYKRTVANTDGTATNPTPVNYDSGDAAASAVVSLYSANPSALGAGVVIRAEQYALPVAGTTGYPFFPLQWFVDGKGSKVPVIRNGEFFAINLAGQTVPSGFVMFCTVEWTEDNS